MYKWRSYSTTHLSILAFYRIIASARTNPASATIAAMPIQLPQLSPSIFLPPPFCFPFPFLSLISFMCQGLFLQKVWTSIREQLQ